MDVIVVMEMISILYMPMSPQNYIYALTIDPHFILIIIYAEYKEEPRKKTSRYS